MCHVPRVPRATCTVPFFVFFGTTRKFTQGNHWQPLHLVIEGMHQTLWRSRPLPTQHQELATRNQRLPKKTCNPQLHSEGSCLCQLLFRLEKLLHHQVWLAMPDRWLRMRLRSQRVVGACRFSANGCLVGACPFSANGCFVKTNTRLMCGLHPCIPI